MSNQLSTSMLFASPRDERGWAIYGIEGRLDLDLSRVWVIPTVKHWAIAGAERQLKPFNYPVHMGWRESPKNSWSAILVPSKKATAFEICAAFGVLDILPPVYFRGILKQYDFVSTERDPQIVRSTTLRACYYMHLSIKRGIEDLRNYADMYYRPKNDQ